MSERFGLHVLVGDRGFAGGVGGRLHNRMVLEVTRRHVVPHDRLSVLLARGYCRFMPVTIVSNSDWLLARRADTCRDDLREELLVRRVRQDLVQVAILVEIDKFAALTLTC